MAAIHGRLVVEDNSGGALKEVTPLTNEFKTDNGPAAIASHATRRVVY